jgi:DNA repair exonuclease SbcCD ATPase subunit
MDDWMNNKLDKYEKFKCDKVRKMELTPPKQEKKVEINKKEMYTLPLKTKLLKEEQSRGEQRDDSDTRHHDPTSRLDMTSRLQDLKSETSTDYERTMNYYRTLGQNESLQHQLKSQSHEVASLQHRLEDMESWYQGRLEELGMRHGEEIQMYEERVEGMDMEHREEIRLMKDDWEKSQQGWMQEKERMEKEIAELTSEVRGAKLEVMGMQTQKQMAEDKLETVTEENRRLQEENRRMSDEIHGCKVENDRLSKENAGAKGLCESMERDLLYHKNERERIEGIHQARISELTEERQRDKEIHQATMSKLMKDHDEEKGRAFHDASEWKMRQKEIHDAMIAKMKEEQERERERAHHEVQELEERRQREVAELEEQCQIETQRAFQETQRALDETDGLKKQLQSMQRELEAEMTRNASMSKDRNAMADMLDNSVSKMEEMHHHILELEKQKVKLMVANDQLEAENTRAKVLAREKALLEGTVDGYHAQMAELQRKNQELESETMSLKQELIDVLEVASHYQ